mmetsp:Transcript_26971/g.65062  ORF Transcript_26971/g.65062 Transcript_26971/m.65062 type:complete len:553 (+) Transcript_26971:41-1699(+)
MRAIRLAIAMLVAGPSEPRKLGIRMLEVHKVAHPPRVWPVMLASRAAKKVAPATVMSASPANAQTAPPQKGRVASPANSHPAIPRTDRTASSGKAETTAPHKGRVVDVRSRSIASGDKGVHVTDHPKSSTFPRAGTPSQRRRRSGSQQQKSVKGQPATGGRRNGKRSSGRVGDRRKNRPAQETTAASFASTLSLAKLERHAEQIQLARSVQRLAELETLYMNMVREESKENVSTARPAQRAPIAAEATAALVARMTPDAEHRPELPDFSFEWAALTNQSVHDLQKELSEGLRARNKIVSSNLGLVHHEVFKLKRSCGGQLDSGTTEQDLIQEGCISLLRAAEKFDVSVGVRFSTYATFWVRAAIRRALQEQTRAIRLPSRVQAQYSKIREARRTLAASSIYRPTEEQVAQYLCETGTSITPHKVREVTAVVTTRPASLDSVIAPGSSTSSDSKLLLDLIEDPDEGIEESMALNMLRGHLEKLFDEYLDSDEAQCVKIRFGLEDGQPATVKATGEAMGITYASTKKLLFSAMSKLRKPHVAAGLKDYMEEDSI